MYSKSRNTLTALIVASLFLATSWLAGRPLDATQLAASHATPAPAASTRQDPPGIGQAILHGHRVTRLSLAMPYYSFSLTTSDRRAD